eukprot:1502285-Amphidinium_carterae.1
MSGAMTAEQHSKLVQAAASEFEEMPGLEDVRKREVQFVYRGISSTHLVPTALDHLQFAMAVALRESASASGDLKELCGEALFASSPKCETVSGAIAKKLLSKTEKAREHLEGLVKLQPVEERTGDKLEAAVEILCIHPPLNG